MRFKDIRILFVISGLVLYSQCTTEFINDGRIVCFEQEVYPLLVSSCTQSECHNSIDLAGNLDYTQIDGILKIVHPGSYRKSKLYQVITDPFNVMPPKPFEKLTKDQITTISLWIEQGANTKDTCLAELCDSSFVRYSTTIKPILDVFCNGCHTGSRPGGGIDYNTFAGVKATVNNGKLMGSIKRESGYSFMPKNGNKLSPCKIGQIQKWIDEGALNN